MPESASERIQLTKNKNSSIIMSRRHHCRGQGDAERNRGKENNNHTDRNKESQKDRGVPGLRATGGYHARLVGWRDSQNATVAVSNACSCTAAH